MVKQRERSTNGANAHNLKIKYSDRCQKPFVQEPTPPPTSWDYERAPSPLRSWAARQLSWNYGMVELVDLLIVLVWTSCKCGASA